MLHIRVGAHGLHHVSDPKTGRQLFVGSKEAAQGVARFVAHLRSRWRYRLCMASSGRWAVVDYHSADRGITWERNKKRALKSAVVYESGSYRRARAIYWRFLEGFID